MIFLYVLLSVYILAVNFYAARLVKTQREEWENGEAPVGNGDSKLILAGLFGGALAVYVCMFVYRYRLSNFLLMIAMPVLAVANSYLFYLGFRGIYGFF